LISGSDRRGESAYEGVSGRSTSGKAAPRRRTGGAEGAVGLEENATLVTPRLEIVLRIEGVELDL
jgi:hypothetical protein